MPPARRDGLEFLIVGVVFLGLVGAYLFSSMQESQNKKAQKAQEKGDLDRALTIFMDSLRKDPDNVETLWHLGNINEEKKLFPEAIGYYTKLIEYGKESKLFTQFELYRRVGLLYRGIGRDKEALEYLLDAHDMIPSAKDVLENISRILFQQKAFFRALAFFEKAAQFIEGNADLFRDYGFCLIMLDKPEDAMPILEGARRINPQDTVTKVLLAYCYNRAGNWAQCRELVEDVINSTGSEGMNLERMLYDIKILFVAYMSMKNFEVSKDLVLKMQEIAGKIADPKIVDDVAMAYIFFRIKQGYYENALDELMKRQSFSSIAEDSGKSNPGASVTPLFTLVSALNKYKKDREKLLVTSGGFRGPKFDFEFSAIESNIKETLDKVERIYDEWRMKYVPKEPLWDFFGPKPKTQFDPVPVLERFKGDIKSVLGSGGPVEVEEMEEVHVDSDDPCQTLASVEFPKFLELSRRLADAMGFRVINQAIKLDKAAYGEGKGCDLLCTEKFNQNNRVLFCVRRWTEQIGNLTVTDLLSSLRTYQATRIVLVSTSPLSTEATLSIEGRSVMDFYLCDDIAQYLI
jgi:tetratricopeptide (TPR) repeat protein